MARRIVIDIETVPRPGIMDTWYPQWASEKYPGKEGDELERMAALHAEFGMICAVAFVNALTKDEPTVYTASSVEEETKLLERLYGVLDNESVVLLGHNIKGFDIPFFAKRYMAQGFKVPLSLNFGGKKPWEIPHKDTMEIMRFAGDCSMSLRSACLLMGIADPKGDMCGADVYELFKKGDVAPIGEYCKGDVVAERELVKVLQEALS